MRTYCYTTHALLIIWKHISLKQCDPRMTRVKFGAAKCNADVLQTCTCTKHEFPLCRFTHSYRKLDCLFNRLFTLITKNTTQSWNTYLYGWAKLQPKKDNFIYVMSAFTGWLDCKIVWCVDNLGQPVRVIFCFVLFCFSNKIHLDILSAT